jgi:hypothetical protein
MRPVSIRYLVGIIALALVVGVAANILVEWGVIR